MLAFAKAGLAVAVLVVLAGLATDASERLSSGSTDTWKDIAQLGSCAIGGLAAFLVFLSAGAAAISKEAWLEVGSDSLVIHHKGLFRSDVRIERTHVAAISYDLQPRKRLRRGAERFEIPDGNEPLVEGWPMWLYSRPGGAPFPILGRSSDPPHLAFCFTEPIAIGPVRRWTKIFPARASIHPPIHGRRARGLLVPLSDPEEAPVAFAGWALPPITADHLFEVRPTDKDRKKVRLLARLDGAAIAVLLFTLLVLPLLLQDPATGSFLIPARGVCKSLDEVRTPAGDPIALPDVAVMSDLVPDDPGDKGYFILDGTSFTLNDETQHEFAAIFEERDLENAYFVRWGRPNFSLYTEIYDAGDPAAARDLQAALLGRACVDASEAFKVEGVPGSAGLRWAAQEGIVNMTFIARDDYVFWFALIETGSVPGKAELIEVARAVDAKLQLLSD